MIGLGLRLVLSGGREAITHWEIQESFNGRDGKPVAALLACQLETGRTHQIRIHLAEAGHPVCGEKVYCRRSDGTTIPDDSGCPRQFLHATELGFQHPVSAETLRWEMPLPEELSEILASLRPAGENNQNVSPQREQGLVLARAAGS